MAMINIENLVLRGVGVAEKQAGRVRYGFNQAMDMPSAMLFSQPVFPCPDQGKDRMATVKVRGECSTAALAVARAGRPAGRAGKPTHRRLAITARGTILSGWLALAYQPRPSHRRDWPLARLNGTGRERTRRLG